MKKLMILLGVMLVFMMSMVSAEVIDDFSAREVLDVTQQGHSWSISGSSSFLNDGERDVYRLSYGTVSTNIDYVNSETVRFVTKCDEGQCIYKLNYAGGFTIVTFYTDSNTMAFSVNGQQNSMSYTPSSYYTIDIKKEWMVDEYIVSFIVDDVLKHSVPINEGGFTSALFEHTGGASLYMDLFEIVSSNTAPVINSLTPAVGVNLYDGDSQVYSADVTDADGDAVYAWLLNGVLVSSSETYTAVWSELFAGVNTLELNVSDVEYSDVSSVSFDVMPAGVSQVVLGTGGGSDNRRPVSADVVVVVDDVASASASVVVKQNIFQQFWSWFRGLFR